MTSSRLLSFEELLRKVPVEKWHLLDRKVENSRHLARIAQRLTEWREVLPFLLENDTEEAEEAITEDYKKTKRRRLVHSEVERITDGSGLKLAPSLKYGYMYCKVHMPASCEYVYGDPGLFFWKYGDPGPHFPGGMRTPLDSYFNKYYS